MLCWPGSMLAALDSRRSSRWPGRRTLSPRLDSAQLDSSRVRFSTVLDAQSRAATFADGGEANRDHVETRSALCDAMA